MPQVKLKVVSDATITRALVYTLPDDPEAAAELIGHMSVGELTLTIESSERCVVALSIIGAVDASATLTVKSGGNDLLSSSPAKIKATSAGVWAGTIVRFDVS